MHACTSFPARKATADDKGGRGSPLMPRRDASSVGITTTALLKEFVLLEKYPSPYPSARHGMSDYQKMVVPELLVYNAMVTLLLCIEMCIGACNFR
eukprot:scaffold41964_cov61-Attheya_sp.AAC.4